MSKKALSESDICDQYITLEILALVAQKGTNPAKALFTSVCT
jgi:hypothetical protein